MASLARPPSPALPMWKQVGKQRAEHRLGLGEHLAVAADEAYAFAAAHLAARTRDRGLEKAKAACGDPLGERGDAIGVAGAGAQHQASRPVAQHRKQLPLEDVLDLVGGEHRKHDRIAVLCDFLDRSCRPATELDELGGLGWIDIETRDREAPAEQTVRQRLAQQADTDQADRARLSQRSHRGGLRHVGIGRFGIEPEDPAARPWRHRCS